jgi:Sec-independent protein translocase protein TatA
VGCLPLSFILLQKIPQVSESSHPHPRPLFCCNQHALSKTKHLAGQWYCTPLIPALGRQRQAWISEFKASLIYRVSSRTARATQRNPVSKNQNQNQNQTKQNNPPKDKNKKTQTKNKQTRHLIVLAQNLSRADIIRRDTETLLVASKSLLS